MRLGLDFNITAEMQREYNQNLVDFGDNTDFVVASNMSSLFLAQVAENPELLPVFREILSLEGNELYLRPAASLYADGTHTTAEIRSILLAQGFVFVGYKPEGAASVFNPPLDAAIELAATDQLIVIGEE